eukprot:1141273-Pelagomonas_calceolata.AAC.10
MSFGEVPSMGCKPQARKFCQSALQCQGAGWGHEHSVLKLICLVVEQKLASAARPAHLPP